MGYDPQRHHRRSIRLPRYDYSQAGAYYVTVCADNRECLFGQIIDGQMRLSRCGAIVAEEWLRTAILRPTVTLDEFVIMPNHIHGIIVLHPDRTGTSQDRTGTSHDRTGTSQQCTGTLQRAPTNDAPTDYSVPSDPDRTGTSEDCTGTLQRAPTDDAQTNDAAPTNDDAAQVERFGQPTSNTIPTIVRLFKAATTRRINEDRQTPGAPVWQRNYYEHVIRNEAEWDRIRAYIAANPARWSDDMENPNGKARR